MTLEEYDKACGGYSTPEAYQRSLEYRRQQADDAMEELYARGRALEDALEDLFSRVKSLEKQVKDLTSSRVSVAVSPPPSQEDARPSIESGGRPSCPWGQEDVMEAHPDDLAALAAGRGVVESCDFLAQAVEVGRPMRAETITTLANFALSGTLSGHSSEWYSGEKYARNELLRARQVLFAALTTAKCIPTQRWMAASGAWDSPYRTDERNGFFHTRTEDGVDAGKCFLLTAEEAEQEAQWGRWTRAWWRYVDEICQAARRDGRLPSSLQREIAQAKDWYEWSGGAGFYEPFGSRISRHEMPPGGDQIGRGLRQIAAALAAHATTPRGGDA